MDIRMNVKCTSIEAFPEYWLVNFKFDGNLINNKLTISVKNDKDLTYHPGKYYNIEIMEAKK